MYDKTAKLGSTNADLEPNLKLIQDFETLA